MERHADRFRLLVHRRLASDESARSTFGAASRLPRRIRLARKAHLPLRIAAKIPRQQSHYFKQQIEPLLDGDQVEFVGEVNERQKQDFLSNAMAVLFPIDWPEPFGLVMIEAMACGTPVIAWRCGSVPEIIENGVTGFIVENEDEAIDAIEHIPDLDRRLDLW
jgi:glycosyltransferase involved in cell wall biosynthesis